MTDRPFMIQTKACQRLQKEVAHYRAELRANEETLEAMMQDTDQYTPSDVKLFRPIVEESQQMVPHAQGRYQEALGRLAELLADYTTSDYYALAQELLNDWTDPSTTTTVTDLKPGEEF